MTLVLSLGLGVVDTTDVVVMAMEQQLKTTPAAVTVHNDEATEEVAVGTGANVTAVVVDVAYWLTDCDDNGTAGDEDKDADDEDDSADVLPEGELSTAAFGKWVRTGENMESDPLGGVKM